VRRPRRTLAALAVPSSSLNIPGTEASRANALLEAYFGPSAPFPILLQGPAAALDHQGPRPADFHTGSGESSAFTEPRW